MTQTKILTQQLFDVELTDSYGSAPHRLVWQLAVLALATAELGEVPPVSRLHFNEGDLIVFCDGLLSAEVEEVFQRATDRVSGGSGICVCFVESDRAAARQKLFAKWRAEAAAAGVAAEMPVA